jgi:ABC-type nitrate/sulfonate/bicarbonate transport system substrate-binding protein
VRAEDEPKVVRIGTQKGGFFFPAVKQRHTVEDAFKPLRIDVRWVDFQFGPPLLEAINVGSVDFGYVGYVGDAPPIFAQAANARIRYAAAVKQGGGTQAIIVRQGSPIKSVADLKGKRVAFGKDRVRIIFWSRLWRRRSSPGATSIRFRWRRRQRPLLGAQLTPGRSGTPILRSRS